MRKLLDRSVYNVYLWNQCKNQVYAVLDRKDCSAQTAVLWNRTTLITGGVGEAG